MRGRFAPSPTGYIHLGNVWSAFVSWLQVRQQGGTLVLRMEDIDEQRSKPVYAKALMEDLAWLGLDWDEGPDKPGEYGPYTQQERYDIYETALAYLREKGLLYPCYCSRARLQAIGAPHRGEHVIYDGHCYGLSEEERLKETKKPSWRVHVPHACISFTDDVMGSRKGWLTDVCGDFVVRRADGLYAYQLAVSVDDWRMGITHVVRGCDLLSSTEQQIWLIHLFGGTSPHYCHVPMVVDEMGNRLSKRQEGITIRKLRESGATADGILSYLAYAGGLLTDFAYLNREELIASCDLKKLTDAAIIVRNSDLDSLRKGQDIHCI